MEIIEFEHPVARDFVTRLRRKDASPAGFRAYSNRLGYLLAVEATRDLTTVPAQVSTPLEETLGEVVENPPVIIPVLRAGLGILDAFQNLLPDSPVAFIGINRDESTAEPVWHYTSIPNVAGRKVIVLDPMLATGGTARSVVEYLFDKRASEVILVSVVAAPEGIARLKDFDNLTVITVCVDRELDASWYIRPGLGDYGDRLFSGGN
ncbi:uracil phosphoribosyltransferase [Candidatus Fermentibacteria bacterium]|nr:MAG: uracil phosphoribosyltransferase [Candidatus Fermentibacteria bacterium]